MRTTSTAAPSHSATPAPRRGEARIFERLLVRFQKFLERSEFLFGFVFAERILLGQIREQFLRLLLLLRGQLDGRQRPAWVEELENSLASNAANRSNLPWQRA